MVLPSFEKSDLGISEKLRTFEIDGRLVLGGNVKWDGEFGTATIAGQPGGRHKVVVIWNKEEHRDVNLGQGSKKEKHEL